MREQRAHVAPFFWEAGTGAIDTGASRSIDMFNRVNGGLMCVDKVESECNRAARLYQNFAPRRIFSLPALQYNLAALHASSIGAFEPEDVPVIGK